MANIYKNDEYARTFKNYGDATPSYGGGLIDFSAKYQQINNPEPAKRSTLNEIFDALSIGQYATAGLVKGSIEGGLGEGLKQAGKGIAQGASILPFWEGYKEPADYSYTDVLDSAGWEPETKGGKFARSAVGFTGDVLLDPLTYVGVGALGKVLKGTQTASKLGARVGREALEKTAQEFTEAGLFKAATAFGDMAKKGRIGEMTIDVAKEVIKKSGNKVSGEALEKEASALVKSFNKLGGVGDTVKNLDISLGYVPFSDKVIKKMTGDVAPKITILSDAQLRKIGDKTIAPYINDMVEGFYTTALGQKLSTKTGLRGLAATDPVKTYQTMTMLAEASKMGFDKAGRLKLLDDFLTVKGIKKLTPSQQKKVITALENPEMIKWVNSNTADVYDSYKDGHKAFLDSHLPKDDIKDVIKPMADGAKEFDKGINDKLGELSKMFDENLKEASSTGEYLKDYGWIEGKTAAGKAARTGKAYDPQAIKDEFINVVNERFPDSLDTKLSDYDFAKLRELYIKGGENALVGIKNLIDSRPLYYSGFDRMKNQSVASYFNYKSTKELQTNLYEKYWKQIDGLADDLPVEQYKELAEKLPLEYSQKNMETMKRQLGLLYNADEIKKIGGDELKTLEDSAKLRTLIDSEFATDWLGKNVDAPFGPQADKLSRPFGPQVAGKGPQREAAKEFFEKLKTKDFSKDSLDKLDDIFETSRLDVTKDYFLNSGANSPTARASFKNSSIQDGFSSILEAERSNAGASIKNSLTGEQRATLTTTINDLKKQKEEVILGLYTKEKKSIESLNRRIKIASEADFDKAQTLVARRDKIIEKARARKTRGIEDTVKRIDDAISSNEALLTKGSADVVGDTPRKIGEELDKAIKEYLEVNPNDGRRVMHPESKAGKEQVEKIESLQARLKLASTEVGKSSYAGNLGDYGQEIGDKMGIAKDLKTVSDEQKPILRKALNRVKKAVPSFNINMLPETQDAAKTGRDLFTGEASAVSRKLDYIFGNAANIKTGKKSLDDVIIEASKFNDEQIDAWKKAQQTAKELAPTNDYQAKVIMETKAEVAKVTDEMKEAIVEREKWVKAKLAGEVTDKVPVTTLGDDYYTKLVDAQKTIDVADAVDSTTKTAEEALKPIIHGYSRQEVDAVIALRDSLIEMGMEASDAGLLRPEQFSKLMGAYFPRKLTAKGAEHFNKLNVEDENKLRTFVTDLFGFKQSNRADFTKSRVAGISDIIDYNNRQGFEVFSEDLISVYMARGIEQGEAIYQAEFSKKLLNDLGELAVDNKGNLKPLALDHIYGVAYGDIMDSVNRDAVAKVRKILKSDPGLDASLTRSGKKIRNEEIARMIGEQRKLTGQKLGIDLSNNGDWAKPIVELSPSQAVVMNQLGGAAGSPKQIHKAQVDLFNHKRNIEVAKKSNQLLNVYDKFLSLYKTQVTALLPGWHARNAVSNQFQNFLSIGSDITDMNLQRGATQAIRKQNHAKVFFDDVTYGQLYDEAKQSGLLESGYFNVDFGEGADSFIKGFDDIKSMNTAAERGKTIGEVTKDTVKGSNANPFSKDFLPARAGRTVGSFVEERDRLVHFMSLRRNGMDVADATNEVNHFLFDYDDLTVFEHTVMKRVVPFYTWMKKNTSLQYEQLMQQPEVYRNIAKTISAIEGTVDREDRVYESDRPEYASDWVQLSGGGDDGNLFINPAQPYQDVNNLSLGVAGAASRLTPALKAPLELGMNKNLFFNSPIAGEETPNTDRVKYVLDYIEVLQTGRKLINPNRSDDAKERGLLNRTTGIKFGKF